MLISIIIPCHNCALTIDRAVNSVFSQTYKDWELILVNNNSTDHTWEKLNDIREQYPEKPITILDEKKKGAPAARNKGLYEAKGEWIQFLDADDELLPEKLEHQIDLIGTNDVSVVYGNAKVISPDKIYIREIVGRDAWEALILSQLGITSANLFKKTDLLNIKGWDEKLTSSQEYNLMFKLLKEQKNFVPDTSINTIIHKIEDSISNTTDKKKLKKIIESRIGLRNSIDQYLKENDIRTPERVKSFYQYIRSEYIKNFNQLPLYVFFKIQFSKNGFEFCGKIEDQQIFPNTNH